MAYQYDPTNLNYWQQIAQNKEDIANLKSLAKNTISANAAYINNSTAYDISDLSIPADLTLQAGDLILFNNAYIGTVDAVGVSTYTVSNAVSIKGPQGVQGEQGIPGNDGADGATGLVGLQNTHVNTTIDPQLNYTYTETLGNFNRTPEVNEVFMQIFMRNYLVYACNAHVTAVDEDLNTVSYELDGIPTGQNIRGAAGANGQDGTNGTNGIGISNIALTSTSGNVDTYTIYMDDNVTTYTFTVTNGTDGSGAKTSVVLYSSSSTNLTTKANNKWKIIYATISADYTPTACIYCYIDSNAPLNNPTISDYNFAKLSASALNAIARYRLVTGTTWKIIFDSITTVGSITINGTSYVLKRDMPTHIILTHTDDGSYKGYAYECYASDNDGKIHHIVFDFNGTAQTGPTNGSITLYGVTF